MNAERRDFLVNILASYKTTLFQIVLGQSHWGHGRLIMAKEDVRNCVRDYVRDWPEEWALFDPASNLAPDEWADVCYWEARAERKLRGFLQ